MKTAQNTHDFIGTMAQEIEFCPSCGYEIRDTAASVAAPAQPVGVGDTVLHPFLDGVIGEVKQIWPASGHSQSLAKVQWLMVTDFMETSLMFYKDLRVG